MWGERQFPFLVQGLNNIQFESSSMIYSHVPHCNNMAATALIVTWSQTNVLRQEGEESFPSCSSVKEERFCPVPAPVPPPAPMFPQIHIGQGRLEHRLWCFSGRECLLVRRRMGEGPQKGTQQCTKCWVLSSGNSQPTAGRIRLAQGSADGW